MVGFNGKKLIYLQPKSVYECNLKNGPQSNTQGVQNNFDPCLSRITQRDAFMHKASKSVGSTGRPPENVPIALESRQKVTVSSELQDMGV
jgi:hypothetical protein